MDRANANSNTKRLISVLALLVVVVCSLGWNSTAETTATTNDNNNNDSLSWIQSVRRKAKVYSELSAIPPDPDSLPVSEDVQKELAAKYGRWHFWDGEEEGRPDTTDLCGKFPPHCDVPGDDFPSDAWQADAVFVNHILNDADGLITRSMETIFEE